jgi:hypothetical protein
MEEQEVKEILVEGLSIPKEKETLKKIAERKKDLITNSK